MPKRRDEVATASPAIMRVNPVLAKEIGLNESIVLLQLDYLISISTSEERDGKQWTYQQWKGGFDQMFPWMAEKTLRRAIDSLKEKGLVETSRHRSYWYTVNRDEIAKITGQNVFLDEAESGQNVSSDDNETRQNVQLEQDKMSSHNKTNCPLPIPNEISTKRSTKTPPVATADAAPVEAKKTKAIKPDKTEKRKATNMATYRICKLFSELFAPVQTKDAEWFSKNIREAIAAYQADDVEGTLRAISARNPNAKATGHTLGLMELEPWIAEWLDAGRPDVFPSVVNFRRSGGNDDRRTNGLQPIDQSAQGTNKYREARILEDAIAERSRSQRRPVSA